MDFISAMMKLIGRKTFHGIELVTASFPVATVRRRLFYFDFVFYK